MDKKTLKQQIIHDNAEIEKILSAKKAERKTEGFFTMMKLVVIFCLFNGVAWVWCSYILAFHDKITIAENLSKVALTEIIAVVFVYAVKSLIENLSKNNDWPDKKLNIGDSKSSFDSPSSSILNDDESDFVFDWSKYGDQCDENSDDGGKI